MILSIKKAMVGGTPAVIAVILLVTSLAMPWYTMESKYEGEQTTTSTSRESLKLFPSESSSERETSNTTSTFNITSWMATIGTIASAVSLMFIGMAIPAEKNKYKKIGMVLLVIGLIFALIAPIYLMTSYPDAFKKDSYGEDAELPDHDTPAKSFFGSYSPENSDSEYNWGGGIGWYMSIFGAALLIVSLIFIAISGKDTRRSQNDRYGQPRARQATQHQYPQQSQQRSMPSQQKQGYRRQQPPNRQTPRQQYPQQQQQGYRQQPKEKDKKNNLDHKDSY